MILSDIALRLVLALGGAYVVFAGLDFALGGIISVGWIEPPLSSSIADVAGFHIRDSHVRFIGGLYVGVGLVILASAIWFQALRVTLLAFTIMFFVGGLARFSANMPEVLFGPRVIGGLALELIAMPILFYWVWNTRRASSERA